MKKFFIFTKNHPDLTTTLPVINNYKKVFKNCVLTSKLKKNSVNIIFENFTKENFIEISKFKKKYPHTVLVLSLSEYFDNKLMTFNSFEFKRFFLFKYFILCNFFFIEILVFIKKIVFKLIKKKVNKSYSIQTLKTKNENISYNVVNYLFEIHRQKRRYNNLIKIIPFIDIFFTNHPQISKDENLIGKKVFDAPYLIKENFKSKKKRILIFSGILNNFRREFLKNIILNNKNKKLNFQINKILNDYKSSNFIKNYENKIFGKFSLNLPISKNWRFQSNTRIYNSLNQGEIPISIGFYDKYFSKLTVNLSSLNSLNFNKLIKSEKKIIARLKKNIRKHNTSVKLNLRKFSKLLKN